MKINELDINRKIEEIFPKIVKFARRKYLKAAHYDVDDLIQEGAVGLLKEIIKNKGSISNNDDGWYIIKVRYCMIDAIRRLNHIDHVLTKKMVNKVEFISLTDILDVVDSLHGFSDEYSNEHLFYAMSKLRNNHKKLLEEIYFKGIDRADIAKENGIKVEKLWITEQKALKELKNIMSSIDI